MLLVATVVVAVTLLNISTASSITFSTVVVKVIAVGNSTTETPNVSTIVVTLTVLFVKSFVLLIIKVTLLTALVAVTAASPITSVTFSTNSVAIAVALTLSNTSVIVGTTVPIELVASIDVGDCAVATIQKTKVTILKIPDAVTISNI